MNTAYALSEIQKIAQEVIATSKSHVIAFYGDIGVGKTTLIKELATQLGVTEKTSSPTFSIVNQYIGTREMVLYHFDCYRLEQPEEILDLGFEEYLEDGAWIFIEWPEKIIDYLPQNCTSLTIKYLSEHSRSIVMH